MKKILLNSSLLLIITFLINGCTNSNPNPLTYKTEIKDKLYIPEICREEYRNILPKVAVVKFTNNSSFDNAEVENINYEGVAKTNAAGLFVGALAPRGVVGAGVGSAKTNLKSKTDKTKRTVKAKLDEAIVPMVENLVQSIGGAEIFSREDMEKIDTELKLQDSGLLDPTTLVKLGKLSGVTLLITGSIDAVEQKYRGNSEIAKSVRRISSKSDNDAFKIASELLNIGTELTDGMFISPKVTLKIIDVSTGKIVFTKQIENSINIGKFPNPNYEQIIGGIKTAILQSLPQVKDDFSRYFMVKGYVTRLKSDGDNLLAQINLGSEYNIQEDQIFDIFTIEESEDPLTGVKTCDKIRTGITLQITDRISKKSSWAIVKDAKKGDIKLMQLVQRSQERGGFAFPKF